MTGVVALGCFVVGFGFAWIARTAYMMAQASWWQERMQRKVRYWQTEAFHARAVAELLTDQLAAATGRQPAATDWPSATEGREEEWP
jgi:hypothetical protein